MIIILFFKCGTTKTPRARGLLVGSGRCEEFFHSRRALEPLESLVTSPVDLVHFFLFVVEKEMKRKRKRKEGKSPKEECARKKGKMRK